MLRVGKVIDTNPVRAVISKPDGAVIVVREDGTQDILQAGYMRFYCLGNACDEKKDK